MVDPLLLEIDDELRRERMQKLWQRCGQYVVTLSFAIVLVTAAFVAWKSYEDAKNQAWTSQLLTAQTHIIKSETTQAMGILNNLMQDASSDISTLARLWATQLLVKQEKYDDAKNMVQLVALDEVKQPYRDLFTLYQTLLGMENAALPSNSEFGGLIKEAKALTTIETNVEEAKKLLDSIEKDATLSSIVRERALLIGSTVEKQ